MGHHSKLGQAGSRFPVADRLGSCNPSFLEPETIDSVRGVTRLFFVSLPGIDWIDFTNLSYRRQGVSGPDALGADNSRHSTYLSKIVRIISLGIRFFIALICTAATAPSLAPLYQYNDAALYMAVPLLSAVLAMLSANVLREAGLTRALNAWILIGILMALVVVETQSYGYSRHSGFAKAGFLAYLPSYVLGVIAALGVWFNSQSTRPQKVLLTVFLASYFLPFHLPYLIKDPGNIYAFCTVMNLSLLAIFLASVQQRKLFQFLLFVVGVRFLILYFQAFGGLALTGFGLIMSGVLIISMVVYWNKYRVQMAAWSEGLLK